jgi:methyl-accepting chemotaxis protein
MFNLNTIKGKLIFLVVISLITLSVIITVTTVLNSEKALLESKFQQLASIEAAKKSEISNYLNSLKSLLTSLAVNEGTKDALLAFEDGFYKIKEEIPLNLTYVKSKLADDFEKNYLNQVNYSVPGSESRKDINNYLSTDANALLAQYMFITDNSANLGEKNNLTYDPKYSSTYMSAHRKYHKSFDTILNAYSLYDIFMVDTKGNLIYTDFKEKDFATNLNTGVYKDTGIANVYKKALTLEEGKIAFDDFRPYEPSYNAAASFISTPIYIENNLKGVLIFQMPIDIINNIMQFDGKYIENI